MDSKMRLKIATRVQAAIAAMCKHTNCSNCDFHSELEADGGKYLLCLKLSFDSLCGVIANDVRRGEYEK
jgi:hypothetical protein